MQKIQKENMVRNQVRGFGIHNQDILNAMLLIDRHLFVLEKFQGVAYSDAELPVDNNRYIARPEMIATLLNSANITSKDYVLEIGCTTGYATQIISQLSYHVIGIDFDDELLTIAKQLSKNIQNICFDKYNNIKSLVKDASIIIVNGAVFDKHLNLSIIKTLKNIFDFKTAMLIDELINIMPINCKLFCVEGYYKYHPMYIVKYENHSRKVLNQVYFPEIIFDTKLF